jgi:hypothetical protein
VLVVIVEFVVSVLKVPLVATSVLVVSVEFTVRSLEMSIVLMIA